jgi:hypothetical protein
MPSPATCMNLHGNRTSINEITQPQQAVNHEWQAQGGPVSIKHRCQRSFKSLKRLLKPTAGYGMKAKTTMCVAAQCRN